MAGTIDRARGTPWMELSPSLGFLIALVCIGVGLHFSSLGFVGFGGGLILTCLIGAAVLEFRADRAAAQSEGRESMGMLHASSDWMAIGQNRRRSGQ